MKSTSLCCVLALAMVTSPMTFAQELGGSAIPVIAGSGQGGRIYVGGEGSYKQIEVDVAKVANKVLDQEGILQREDRDYVLSAVQQIHEAYVDLAQAVITDDILKMNAAGIKGETVEVENFMAVTAAIKAKRVSFVSTLEKNASINKQVLPSNYETIANSEGATQQVPTVGDIDLSSVVSTYMALVESDIDQQLAQYQNIKIEVYGKVLGIDQYKDILEPDFSSLPPLSPDKILELTQEMEDFREQSRNIVEEEQQEFANVMRAEYNEFSRLYGSDYKYVPRTGEAPNESRLGNWTKAAWQFFFGDDEAHSEAGRGNAEQVQGFEGKTDFALRSEAFKRLVDTFWTRSYLRLTQGLQICAVQPKQVDETNFGGYQAVEALKQLRTQPACTKSELEAALKYAQRIVKYADIQSDHVFDKDSGFLKAGLVNKIGSAVTFALGNRPSAEALNMLMQLVYMDIQEELIMATPGQGLRALREMYAARYQAGAEQKAYYSSLKCSYDVNLDSCKGTNQELSSAFDETPGVGMEGDVRAVFLDLQAKNNAAKDLIDYATGINETLNASRKGSVAHQNTNKRAEEL